MDSIHRDNIGRQGPPEALLALPVIMASLGAPKHPP